MEIGIYKLEPDDDIIKENEKLQREMEEKVKHFAKNVQKKVEEELRKKMVECGDFDPSHYEVRYLSDVITGDSSIRRDLYFEVKKKEGF